LSDSTRSILFSSEERNSIKIKNVVLGTLPLEDELYAVPTFAPNSVLDTSTIDIHGTVTVINTQVSDYYLESTRFSVARVDDPIPCGGLNSEKWCVTVYLKDWTAPETKEVSTTTQEQVPGEITHSRMQGIREFRLDDCSGD